MSGFAAEEALRGLADEVWRALVDRDPYTAATAGLQPKGFPRGDLVEAESVAAAARARLDRLDCIDVAGLGRTERTTAAHLRYWLEDETREPLRWWTGFGVAPYSMSGFSVVLSILFPGIDLERSAEAERYLALADGYAEAVVALRERIEAQAARGWRLPRPAIPGARKTIEGIGTSAAVVIALSEDRAAPEAVRLDIAALVEERLKPAFERLLEAIGPDYEHAAPEAVGICHQPGGADAYRDWIRYHLSYDAEPEEIHRIGLAEVERLSAAMERLRVDAFGHNGDEASFHEQLRQDPRAKAPTPEALAATYDGHLARMAPVFAKLVRHAPKARARVERLAPALEAGMTFGYYDPPSTPGADGVYYYSGNGIPDRLQMNAAPLIYHELVPGHHVAITRQAENHLLPDLRRRTFAFTAFNEGWAEYSAGLAEEAGLYDDPYDLYGWLAHQRFVAQRLVVDTGLNFYGWSLEQARAYMLANTLESEAQVASETLRYATDLPAQSLAYRMGFLKFRELRDRARHQLGDAFDLAEFHECILEQGCLPIKVLERSLDGWADEQLAKAA
ncbi:DUF885 domain-containing protein [Sphingopyxis granuli]|uniref:DUF885 domain-containing protein n=1 Tax=Sphingopyxis granuli TaxID=267128 RepID=UPI00301C21AD